MQAIHLLGEIKHGIDVWQHQDGNNHETSELDVLRIFNSLNDLQSVELTWNYGSEKEEGKVYNTGNADSTGTSDGEKIRGGFGHIGITVPNVYKACERFHKMGVEFHKSPNAGGMKGLAFIKDPDGYLVEVIPQDEMIAEPVDCLGVAAEGGEGYKDNSK